MNAVTLGNGGLLLQLFSESNRRQTNTLIWNMIPPPILEVIILFHGLSVFTDRLQKNTLSVPQDYHMGTMKCFCVQSLLKTWRELIGRSPFTEFSKEMAPYMLFTNSSYQFQALATHSENLSVLSQQNKLMNSYSQINGEKEVDASGFDSSANMDDALRYETYLMFDCLHSLILISNL